MAANSSGSGQAQGFSSPQEEAMLNLMRSADSLHRALQQRIKPSGLTMTQYNVLRILRAAPADGLTCSAIGRMMISPEPDITRLLARLKTQKLLRQQRDRHDRRIVRTHITPLGAQTLAKLDGVVEEAPQALMRELTHEELRELTRLVKKVRCGEETSESQGSANAKPPLRSQILPRLHPE